MKKNRPSAALARIDRRRRAQTLRFGGAVAIGLLFRWAQSATSPVLDVSRPTPRSEHDITLGRTALFTPGERVRVGVETPYRAPINLTIARRGRR